MIVTFYYTGIGLLQADLFHTKPFNVDANGGNFLVRKMCAYRLSCFILTELDVSWAKFNFKRQPSSSVSFFSSANVCDNCVFSRLVNGALYMYVVKFLVVHPRVMTGQIFCGIREYHAVF